MLTEFAVPLVPLGPEKITHTIYARTRNTKNGACALARVYVYKNSGTSGTSGTLTLET